MNYRKLIKDPRILAAIFMALAAFGYHCSEDQKVATLGVIEAISDAATETTAPTD
jgi:hypothetical protein